jgi:hypothetical protein
MPPTKATRPQADVFLPAPGTPGAGGGTPKLFGMNRNVAILVLIGGAIAAYLLYRHFKGSGTSTASSDQSNIDPATGFPYGSPEDLAALGETGGGGAANPVDNTGSVTPQATGDLGVTDQLLREIRDLTAGLVQTSGQTAPSSAGTGAGGQPTGGATTNQITPAPALSPAQQAAALGATAGAILTPQTQAAAAALHNAQAGLAPDAVIGSSPGQKGTTISLPAAKQVSQARPGGVSSNKKQGVYSIH